MTAFCAFRLGKAYQKIGDSSVFIFYEFKRGIAVTNSKVISNLRLQVIFKELFLD